MYELSDEGTIDFNHNPFSMPQGGLEDLNTKNPLDILAYQYDLVCNGVELSSGAVRNHNPEIMIKAFEIAGYEEEDIKWKSAEVNGDVRKKIIGDAEVITYRPADKIAPEFDAMKEKYGDICKCDEDVLSYIAFPAQAEKFLTDRAEKEKNTYKFAIKKVD